jgi:putative hemolysin
MVNEIIIVFLLTLLNGFFSMSEIALVTMRKTRTAELAKAGNKRAQIVQILQGKPENMFATIQIGISVITIAASAFAGANIGEDLSNTLAQSDFAFISEHAPAWSFFIVVALLSYINITLGELIPKSLGLRYAEPMALLAAYPIYWISRVSRLVIRVLNITSNLVLRIFKDSTNFSESKLSEEEIRSLIYEGHNAGTVASHEYNIIENVFDFSDLSVDKIMVPRARITAGDIQAPTKQTLDKAIESGYSRIPIYKGNIDNVVGILYTKRLLPKLGLSTELNLNEFLVPPYFVPSTMKISEVLQKMQGKRAHMALVTNEHGEVEGLVTLEDVLEEIVGDITDETDEPDKSIRIESGENIVSGDVSIVDFNKYFETDLPENESFNTISGFILELLERFPKVGDTAEYKNILFKVKEASPRSVKSVIVKLRS